MLHPRACTVYFTCIAQRARSSHTSNLREASPELGLQFMSELPCLPKATAGTTDICNKGIKRSKHVDRSQLNVLRTLIHAEHRAAPTHRSGRGALLPTMVARLVLTGGAEEAMDNRTCMQLGPGRPFIIVLLINCNATPVPSSGAQAFWYARWPGSTLLPDQPCCRQSRHKAATSRSLSQLAM